MYSMSALGYVIPVTLQFVSSACDQFVIPYTKDGTVFIPANLISPELLPQLAGPMHQVSCVSTRSRHTIASLPHAFRLCESNGVVLNVPPPGSYSVVLYCTDRVRKLSLKVVAPGASADFLCVTDGIACELLEPCVPVECRISSVKCQDGNLAVGVAGPQSQFKNMKIDVWFCNSFPLGDTLTSSPHAFFFVLALAFFLHCVLAHPVTRLQTSKPSLLIIHCGHRRAKMRVRER